eukprot:g2887.t1
MPSRSNKTVPSNHPIQHPDQTQQLRLQRTRGKKDNVKTCCGSFHRFSILCCLGWSVIATCFGIVLLGRRKHEAVSCVADSSCRGGELCIEEKCVDARDYASTLITNAERGALLTTSSSLPTECGKAAVAAMEAFSPKLGTDAQRSSVSSSVVTAAYAQLGTEASLATTKDSNRVAGELPSVCPLCSVSVPESVILTLVWPELTDTVYESDPNIEKALRQTIAEKLSNGTSTTVLFSNVKVKRISLDTDKIGSGRALRRIQGENRNLSTTAAQLTTEFEVILEYVVAPKTGGAVVTGPYGASPKDGVTANDIKTKLEEFGQTTSSRQAIKELWMNKLETLSCPNGQSCTATLSPFGTVTLASSSAVIKNGSKNAFVSQMGEVTTKYTTDVASAAARTLVAQGSLTGKTSGSSLVFTGGITDAYMCFRHNASTAPTAPTCLAAGTATSITSNNANTTQCTARNNWTIKWDSTAQNHIRWIHCTKSGDVASNPSLDQTIST